jgi:hypothetical protein
MMKSIRPHYGPPLAARDRAVGRPAVWQCSRDLRSDDVVDVIDQSLVPRLETFLFWRGHLYPPRTLYRRD